MIILKQLIATIILLERQTGGSAVHPSHQSHKILEDTLSQIKESDFIIWDVVGLTFISSAGGPLDL